MFDLKRVFFGYSDADTEAERDPDAFKQAFFDPHLYLNELIDGNRFILCGRKGDGKTAYKAQIKLTAEDHNIYAYQSSLNNFNNSVFQQIQACDALGGNLYISFWKAVLLIEYVSMLYKYDPNIQTSGFVNTVANLSEYGFLSEDNDISYTVRKLTELNNELEFKGFTGRRKYEQSTHLANADEIYRAIRASIKNICLPRKFVFIIDGLDDILNYSAFKSEIITGLIRAVEEINREFKGQTLSVKCIVLIRYDILGLCRDPNLSKIIRDSGLKLRWEISGDPFDSDLMKLVSRRIDAVSGYDDSFRDIWKEIFPQNIGNRDAVDYILDNIIYRPRDILQLFIEIQNVFTPNKCLSQDDIKCALTSYSEEYFVEAMRDELTGFFPNDAVTELPEILSKMGARYFYWKDFDEECQRYDSFSAVSTRGMLEKLFQAGYIGQHRPRANADYTVFSYRNPQEKFQIDHECILHRGLTRALTI